MCHRIRHDGRRVHVTAVLSALSIQHRVFKRIRMVRRTSDRYNFSVRHPCPNLPDSLVISLASLPGGVVIEHCRNNQQQRSREHNQHDAANPSAPWHRHLASITQVSPCACQRQRLSLEWRQPIRYYYGAWKAACRKAGVPGRIVHDFRRTAVRNLVRAGVPDGIAMQMTGHKTRSMFDRYDVVNEQDLRDAARRLNVALVNGRGHKNGHSRLISRLLPALTARCEIT